jgi:hypothetical protein
LLSRCTTIVNPRVLLHKDADDVGTGQTSYYLFSQLSFSLKQALFFSLKLGLLSACHLTQSSWLQNLEWNISNFLQLVNNNQTAKSEGWWRMMKKDEGWRMKDEGWRMKDEGWWRMKDDEGEGLSWPKHIKPLYKEQ